MHLQYVICLKYYIQPTMIIINNISVQSKPQFNSAGLNWTEQPPTQPPTRDSIKTAGWEAHIQQASLFKTKHLEYQCGSFLSSLKLKVCIFE